MPGFPMRLIATDGSDVSLPPNPNLAYGIGSSSAGTNDITIKQSPAYLFSVQGYNARTSAVCLRLHNVAAAAPNSPGAVPFVRLYLEAQKSFSFNWPVGLFFSVGLGFGLTTDFTGVSSNGVAAGDIISPSFIYA